MIKPGTLCMIKPNSGCGKCGLTHAGVIVTTIRPAHCYEQDGWLIDHLPCAPGTMWAATGVLTPINDPDHKEDVDHPVEEFA